MLKKEIKMDAQTIVILILTGIGAGILGGLVGVGGGIVIVPALVYFLGFNLQQAQGTSLGLIMLPVGILGFLHYYSTCKTNGYPIDFKVIGLLAIGFVVGSYFGSKISLKLNEETVKKVFAIILILVAAKMLFFDKSIKEKARANNTAMKQ